jgi:hypothetical protein
MLRQYFLIGPIQILLKHFFLRLNVLYLAMCLVNFSSVSVQQVTKYKI